MDKDALRAELLVKRLGELFWEVMRGCDEDVPKRRAAAVEAFTEVLAAKADKDGG